MTLQELEESLQERLDEFQSQLQICVEQAIENESRLEGVPKLIYSFDELYRPKKSELFGDDTQLKENLIELINNSKLIDSELINHSVVETAAVNISSIRSSRDIDRLKSINNLVIQYKDLFTESVGRYRHFSHNDFPGSWISYDCTLQSGIPKIAEENNRTNAREELLIICKEKITENTLPKLLGDLYDVMELYLFSAHDQNKIYR
ncbi:hypothetical protein HOK51_09685 [Candidatus Woesearchaeota archaeon]|nr:hypothetical protein [Candidatus Woesearchaeota archaeon]MBT6520094.1 hypothetical protein [Candidatus Woesearchaeota archaeon]MBT7366699.1 hypothetical protein [Candidatus Woesearchaeota archaeon]